MPRCELLGRLATSRSMDMERVIAEASFVTIPAVSVKSSRLVVYSGGGNPMRKKWTSSAMAERQFRSNMISKEEQSVRLKRLSRACRALAEAAR